MSQAALSRLKETLSVLSPPEIEVVESTTITPGQLRAARALLDWSREDCGRLIGVSAETIKNIECRHFQPHASTVRKIISGFVNHGILFTKNWDGEGVMIVAGQQASQKNE